MNDEIKKLLIKYYTARIDIKNSGNSNNKVQVIKNDDPDALIFQPDWFHNWDGIGTQIESNKCSLTIKLKCINSGTLRFWLKGINYNDKLNNRFPVYIDYTIFEINGENLLHENKVASLDAPIYFGRNVSDGEILKIHIKWLPVNNNSKYEGPSLSLEKKVKSIPQLSCTSFGYPVLNGKLVIRNFSGYGPNFNTLFNDLNGSCESNWFASFLKNKFPDADFKINLFYVFNAHDNLSYPMRGKKVLFSLEDLNYRFLEMKLHYDRYALNHVDFAMGYDLINHPKYLRFPYWIVKHFLPNDSDEEIEKKINMWNTLNYKKNENIVAIASHDKWGVRTLIDNDINHMTDIKYAGKWKNNTSELWDNFNNNKHEYIKKFKFNICAENLISDGYITEKIFDAFTGDCIPLYAGAGNYLEPEVINPKALIRWDGKFEIEPDTTIFERAYYGEGSELKGKWVAYDDCNKDSIELFENILTDEKSYKEFIDQDRLLQSSTKFIIKKFKELEKHFERIIYS